MKFNLQLFNEEEQQMNLVEEDYILPDDYVEEETTDEDTEPTEEAEETQEDETEVSEEETTEESDEDTTEDESEEDSEQQTALEEEVVKFLGESKKLSEIPREELVKYVQTGMNQERFEGKFNSLVETERNLSNTAELFGMDVGEMLSQLREQHFKNVADDEGRNINDVRREYDSNVQGKKDSVYKTFVDKYPDVNPNDLPMEVKMDMQDGLDPIKSYEKYLNTSKMSEKDKEINDLKTKLEALEKAKETKEQNTKTKKKGVITKTKDAGTDHEDDFLKGLLGDN